MDGITSGLYQYGSPAASPWFEPPKPKISNSSLSTFCPVGTAVFDTYRVAGFACFEGASNSNPIAYENSTFVEADCLRIEGRNGNWTPYSCEDVASIHKLNRTALGTNDQDVLVSMMMVSSTWGPACCDEEQTPTKEETRDFWWNTPEVEEFRKGHSKNWIIIKSVLSITSVIASSIFLWMILRSHDGMSTTQNRLFAGLCISDIIFTLPQSFFGVMVPKEQDYLVWNARGNMTSCQIHGFLIVFGGQMGPLYNASLVRQKYSFLIVIRNPLSFC